MSIVLQIKLDTYLRIEILKYYFVSPLSAAVVYTVPTFGYCRFLKSLPSNRHFGS